jgi:hypothetical protein
VRERTPGLGYEFQHANKLYFENSLKLNECLRLALADQVLNIYFISLFISELGFFLFINTFSVLIAYYSFRILF